MAFIELIERGDGRRTYPAIRHRPAVSRWPARRDRPMRRAAVRARHACAAARSLRRATARSPTATCCSSAISGRRAVALRGPTPALLPRPRAARSARRRSSRMRRRRAATSHAAARPRSRDAEIFDDRRGGAARCFFARRSTRSASPEPFSNALDCDRRPPRSTPTQRQRAARTRRSARARPGSPATRRLARPPVRVEPRPPPAPRELVQRRRASCSRPAPSRSRRASAPVLLRPEEDHRASGEADVVPPAAGGHDEVDEQLGAADELAVAHLELERLAAVRARATRSRPSACSAAGMPSASQAQFANHERPPASTRCGVSTAENGFSIRISVPSGCEDERVRVVQPPVGVRDLVGVELERRGGLRGASRAFRRAQRRRRRGCEYAGRARPPGEYLPLKERR